MKTLRKAVAFAMLATLAMASRAQGYPTKPIRLIVPYAAGGATDAIVREVMTALSARLGQPIAVENKGGANSILGLDLVAKAPADGYTLGIAIPAYAVNYTLNKSLPYTRKDLIPVAMMWRSSTLLVTGNPAIKNLNDLKKEAAARGGVTFASSGIGSLGHLKTEAVIRQLGLGPATHIPYRGSAASWTDLISGRVLMSFDTYTVLEPLLKEGKLTALMVVGNGQQRLPQLPNVPTATEMGMAEVDTPSWGAVMAPSGTPKAIQEKLVAEMHAVLTSPEVRRKLSAGNVAPFPTATTAEASDFVTNEVKRLGALVHQLGLEGNH